MKRAAALLALATFLAAGAARAQFVPGSAFSQPPPPPPHFESVPPPPGPGFAWKPGRWMWDGVAWHWLHGMYVSKALVRDQYVPGHWEQDAGAGFRWIPGTMR
jgi:hypothetical protein